MVSRRINNTNKLIFYEELQSPGGGFQEGPLENKKSKTYIKSLKYRNDKS